MRRAGRKLAGAAPPYPEKEFQDAEEWRQAHLQPMLQVFEVLDRRFASSLHYSGVARIKKLDTILKKLARPGTDHNLDRLGDIGGCRFIFHNATDLMAADRLMSMLGFPTKRVGDYWEHPKSTGYRGVHYHIEAPGGAPYQDKNLTIEVQLRTRMQHQWATAVEMYDAARGTSMKFGEKPEPAFRFFQLASKLLEAIERPDRPMSRQELGELCGIDRGSHILSDLEAVMDSVFIPADLSVENEGLYILDFDRDKQVVTPRHLSRKDAVTSYFEREREAISEPDSHHDILLALSGEPDVLEEAFPNYFFIDSGFVRVMRSSLREER